MKQKLLLLLVFLYSCIFSQGLSAQSLAAGDIAFIGYDTATLDGFSFITLKDIPAGEIIYFTEEGWGNAVWASTSEPHIRWTIPTGGVSCGTIISVIETSPNTLTVNGVAGTSFVLNPSGTPYNFNLFGGDQILAYQSIGNIMRPLSPIFIAGVHGDINSTNYDPSTSWNRSDIALGTAESVIPLGLTNGVNCVALYNLSDSVELPNNKYTGTLTGTSDDLRESINNRLNWTKTNSGTQGITPANYVTPNVDCTACTAPTQPTLAATGINCYGSSKTVTITGTLNSATAWHVYTGSCGGTPITTTTSATFSVSPTTTTTYYVRGEGGCVTPGTCGTVTVTVNPQIVITPGQTNVSCNGGSNGTATATVTGGTGDYTYSWSPSGGTAATATGLTAGTYTVTVTDQNLCTATASVTITQPTTITSSITSQTNVGCNGAATGSATVTASGGTGGLTYSWSPSGGTSATATGLTAGNYVVTITDTNTCFTTQNVSITQPSAITVTPLSQTNIACKGTATGAASVTASGGTGTLSYSWSPSGGTAATATGLSAGTYTVTVTDINNCTATQSFTITEPSTGITVTAAGQSNLTCNGGTDGSATVSASGGTGTLSYSWSPSGGTGATATGLTAGTYTVTVTDEYNCTATQSFTITEPAVITVTPFAQTNVGCNGAATGAASVNASGGTGALSYSWSPSGGTAATATGLTAGTYTVTVTDVNSCTATQSFTITEPNVLVASQGTINNPSCFGGNNGTATVNVTGGTGGRTYSWSPSGGTAATASGLGAGTYIVTVTDANGCEATQSFTLTEPTAITTSVSAQTNVSCANGSNGSATVSATGGTGTFTYSWSPFGGTDSTATGLSAGTYAVTVTDTNGCETTQWVSITQPTDITATITAQTNVACRNGNNGSATVSVSGGTPGYTYSWAPSGGTAATATGLYAGTYTVTITDANGCTATQLVTITQPATMLVASTSRTDATCNTGGETAVFPSGGTSPYSYLWSNGATTQAITNLAAGPYSVVITDSNGCSITKNFTVSTTNTLTATTSQTDILCNGTATGSATINVSGNSGALTYVWSPSVSTTATASALTAGTYTVTASLAGGCSITRSFTITQPSALVASIGAQTNLLCNGATTGSATVNVTGGTGAYTYSWSPSGGTAATASGLTAGTYTVTVTDDNSCTATQSFTITEPTGISITPSQTNVSCNGANNGSATVTVTGGTGAYTYSWAPSGGTVSTANELAPGTYTVTVTDANLCTATQSITITQPAALVATASAQTNLLCNGGTTGSATVNVTGGTGAYSYSWSPSGGTAATASGLTAGTYTVTVTDDNSCTATQSFTITQPTAIAITPSHTNVTCNGINDGSATATVTGGTGAYTYLWAPSGGTAATANGLAPGTYTVTVTDANLCTATQSITITQPDALVATASAQTNLLCNGASNGAATVSVTGGTGVYTYSWAPTGGTSATASGLTAGTYTVTVTDANTCTTTQSFTITEPTGISITPSQINVSCNGFNNGTATATVTGGTGAYTYSWSPSGGTAATATGLAPGAYTVTVTDANLCTATQSFTITQPTAIAITPSHTNVSCNGINNGTATATVTGGTGTYTYSWAPSGGTAATATGLVAGTYTVTVTDANLCTATQSFTITQPDALVATPAAQTNILCNDAATGSATVNVTGGTGTYTYSWAPSGGTAATASGLTSGTYVVTVTDANNCTTTQSFTITEPTAIAITPSQINVSCNGINNGTATATVTGGTGTYTYSWAPSGGTAATATGLVAGTYTVTVTDANLCTATQSITITQPAPLVATPAAQTNILCNNAATGSATVNVTGGTGTYTYSWAPSGGTAATASGLTAGTYVVTVTDANLCTATQSFTITQPTALAITPSHTNVTCNGLTNGSATATVTGGTGAYTYSWAPSGGTAATANGLAPGTYTVTVTDANLCTATQLFTITQPTALVATASAQTNLVCNGASNGSATVNVTGGTGAYTYSWAPSGGTAATATGLTAGTYTVTVTDANGCTATQSFTITQPTAITATSIQTNILCNGQNNGSATVTATGGAGNYTYSWAPSGGTAATATELTAGTYTVTITDSAGCTGNKEIVITQPGVLVANSTTTNINCFGASTGIASITVLGGTAPFEYVWTPAVSTTATATGLAVGNYSVVVTDANGCTTSKSFAITQQPELIVTPTQTNVSCNGGSNGTASVIVTGNSPEYFYSWAPTGGNGPAATGLTPGSYTLTITDVFGCVTTEIFNITQPDVLDVTVVQTDIVCGGTNTGEIALTVTGGTEEYSYEWTPNVSTGATASNLAAGDYSVAITDANGCSITRDFSLTQPEALIWTVTKTDALCNGETGSAALTVSGGVGPYTYQWLPSGGTNAEATDLPAGDYTVTITDAIGCVKVENVTITQPQAINITTQPQSANITVNNTATFTTAAGNITGYQWQVSEDGENWTDITDGGTSPVYSGATTSALTVTNVPVSYNGYQYRVMLLQTSDCFKLSNAATLNVTNILVAVDDNFSANTILEGTGGVAGDVTANDLYNNELVEDTDITISIVNTGGLAGVTIDADGSINVPASTPDGTYIVIYRICDAINNGNCSDASVTIVVSPLVGVDDFSKLDINIYPNPASTEVFVKVPDFSSHNNLKASLYDLNGRLVRDGNITTENFSMDVTGLESAIYILNVTSDAGVITKRIAVTKKF